MPPDAPVLAEPIQLAIVDDHAFAREGIASMLQACTEVSVSGLFSNGLSAVAHAREARPQVMLMDISMPILDGVKAMAMIRAGGLETRVIAWTAHEDSRLVREMLDHGAQGYLFKSASLPELLQAICTVMRGERHLPVEAERLLLQARSRLSGDRLSPRERQVLCLIAEGMSTQSIACRLDLKPRTVDGHRRKLAQRLGFQNVALLTRYAIAEGIISPGLDLGEEAQRS